MFTKYKDDAANHYLKALFTYQICELDSCFLYEGLSNYSIAQAKKEVECFIQAPI